MRTITKSLAWSVGLSFGLPDATAATPLEAATSLAPPAPQEIQANVRQLSRHDLALTQCRESACQREVLQRQLPIAKALAIAYRSHREQLDNYRTELEHRLGLEQPVDVDDVGFDVERDLIFQRLDLLIERHAGTGFDALPSQVIDELEILALDFQFAQRKQAYREQAANIAEGNLGALADRVAVLDDHISGYRLAEHQSDQRAAWIIWVLQSHVESLALADVPPLATTESLGLPALLPFEPGPPPPLPKRAPRSASETAGALLEAFQQHQVWEDGE